MKNFDMRLIRYGAQTQKKAETYVLSCYVDNKGRVFGYTTGMSGKNKNDKTYVFGFMNKSGKFRILQFVPCEDNKFIARYIYELNIFDKLGKWEAFLDKTQMKKHFINKEYMGKAEGEVTKIDEVDISSDDKMFILNVLKDNKNSVISVFNITESFLCELINDLS